MHARLLLAAIALLASSADWLRASDARQPTAPPTVWEDAPAPLTPVRSRSAEDEDRIAALSLFASGRLQFQRDDYAGALRLFERAWRSATRKPQPFWKKSSLWPSG